MPKVHRTLQLFTAKTEQLIRTLNNQSHSAGKLEIEPLESRGKNSYSIRATLMEVNERASSRKKEKRVNILLDAKLSYDDRETEKLTGYQTRLSYFKQKPTLKTNQALEGFHFDYRKNSSEKIKAGHPVFHAQLDPLAAKAMAQDKGFPIEEDQETKGRRLRCIRIPSSQMDFFSSIIMLIADHFVNSENETHCREFENYVKDVMKTTPRVNIRLHYPMEGNLEGNLTSCAWYIPSFN